MKWRSGATAGARKRSGEAYDLCLRVLDQTALTAHANRRAESLGLLQRKCKVAVILNATRPLREADGRDAIEELKAKGAEFITTAEVIRVAA